METGAGAGGGASWSQGRAPALGCGCKSWNRKYVIMEPLSESSMQKYVILATFRLRLYASQIQRVQNYVFAEVIIKKTLHNHALQKSTGQNTPQSRICKRLKS